MDTRLENDTTSEEKHNEGMCDISLLFFEFDFGVPSNPGMGATFHNAESPSNHYCQLLLYRRGNLKKSSFEIFVKISTSSMFIFRS